MNEIINNLQQLFLKKQFSKLIFEIENVIPQNQKTLQVMNILGAAKMLKDPNSENSIKSAIENFKYAFAHSKDSQTSITILINLANASCSLYDQFEKNNNFPERFYELTNLFKQIQNVSAVNEKLNLSIYRVYKRLNDLDNAISCLSEISEKKNLSLKSLVLLIFNNNFKNDWKQSDFFYHSKLLEEYIVDYSKYKLTNLKKINKNKNKIKIGFLSADIKNYHSVTYFFKTVLNNYDKDMYEIILILNQSKEDENTKEFIGLVDKIIKIKHLDDFEAINYLRNLEFDIIFDLMGITSSNRLTLFKNRIAPIQVAWLGYNNTTGLNNMDFLFSDKNLIFNEEKKFYSEKIVFFKNIWNCHSGFKFSRNKNASPFIKNKFITFGSLNNFSKINDNVIEVWAAILKKIDKSKLILKSNTKIDTTRIKKLFQKADVENSVYFYEKNYTLDDHLKIYNEIDIALDTFPHPGITTSFEAIWMGVPVLTMKGYNFMSRCGESINKNLNLEYLISKDNNEYISKAIELANNKDKLIKTRNYIFSKALQSPLFNQQDFSNEFFSHVNDIYYNT
jgi:protein O-GlcNAc transferase